MKFMIFFILFTLLSSLAYSKDMRVMVIEAEKKKIELLRKAKEEKERALEEAKQTRERILKDRKTLTDAIKRLEKEIRRLRKEQESFKSKLQELKKKEEELSKRRDEEEADIQELIAIIRSNAKDLKELLNKSLQTAFLKTRKQTLDPIISKLEFPGMEDIQKMVELLFQEIELSGQVRIVNGNFIDRSGKETKGEILLIGNFEAAYRKGKETGFLLYSEASNRLFALSKLPPRGIVKKINEYMDGRSEAVPIDISKGGAIRQLTHRLSLIEQIPKGGPIVIPIIFIGAVAFVLILERSIYLFLKDLNSDRLIDEFMLCLSERQFDRCIKLCERESKKPVFRVLLSGIKAMDKEREEIENILQEAILGEIPSLERFLSTISMIAEISPLLGLLGTVTGIINTFHVITFYGTGDPRMMSSGISEALVTTMLGLMVAIPVMFCHTLLSRKVESIISKMEKSAVSLVNILSAKDGSNT